MDVNRAAEVVQATRYVLADQRGYDDDRGWLNPAVWERAAGRPDVATAEILAAVNDVAGYYSHAVLLDPTDDHDRDTLRWIAEELGAAAAALRATLDEPAIREEE